MKIKKETVGIILLVILAIQTLFWCILIGYHYAPMDEGLIKYILFAIGYSLVYLILLLSNLTIIHEGLSIESVLLELIMPTLTAIEFYLVNEKLMLFLISVALAMLLDKIVK